MNLQIIIQKTLLLIVILLVTSSSTQEQQVSKQDSLVPGNNDLKLNKHTQIINSNKEFIYGDEDNDDDDNESASLFSSSKLTETPSSDTNMLNLKPSTEMNSNEDEVENDDDDEDDDEDDDLYNQLKRNQRVDVKHPLHEKQSLNLIKFNKMINLQRKLAAIRDENNRFDYDEITDDDFLNRLDKQSERRRKDSNEDDLSTELDQDEDDVTEDLERQKSEFLNEIKKKLIKLGKTNAEETPAVEIKEQVYIEGKLNKNPFFIPENELALDNEFNGIANGELLDQDMMMDLKKQNQTNNNINNQPIDSNPSHKQKSNYIDSTDESKYEMIRRQNDLFLFVVAGCTLAGVLALLAASVCWYTVAKSSRSSKSNLEFESSKHSIFGLNQSVTPISSANLGSSQGGGSIRSNKSNSSGDKKLALSAQMYHYQHQKEQMIAIEKANNDTKPDNSDNSDDETPEGDYTVYECPGLAPTGEMEVKNPLFKEDFTGSSPNLNKNQPPPSYSTLTLDETGPAAASTSDKKQETK